MKEWKEVKLESCTSIVCGATPDSTKEEYWNGDINWVTAKDISDAKIKFIDFSERKISNYGLQNCSTKMLPPKTTVLIARGATMGRCAMLRSEMALNQTCFGIFPDPNIADYDFIFYFIKNSFEYFQSISHGAIFNTIIGNSLKNIPILLPPLAEQRAIAGVLSALDDKIDLLHRQNRTLEALAETLFRHHFIDNAQPDWMEGKFSEEFDFTMGQSPEGSTLNEAGQGLPFFQGRADFGFRFPNKRVYTTSPTRYASQFDVLLSVRAPVGDLNIAIEDCAIGRGVAALRYKQNSAYKTYTYYKLRSMIESFKAFNETGTVFGSIGKNDLNDLEVVIPPHKHIKEFQVEVGTIDDKIYLNCLEIHNLETLRDTLLPKLLSGEVGVN
jgi:type I restriction enzyme, S subunit